ncbi:hypothetical protein ABPH35_10490 [Streptococcus sp. ZJ93]|uniref:hypothetical protein n=1 Tax=Streptococcus handemini TaxID=3161188 RepID=UPI0032EED2B0
MIEKKELGEFYRELRIARGSLTGDDALEIDREGHWKALRPGKVRLTISSASDSPQFNEEFEKYGLVSGEGEDTTADLRFTERNIEILPATTETSPVYRLYHAGLQVHLYTTDANENAVLANRGWRQEGEAYRSSGEIPVYRLYHAGIKKHLYTRDENEKNVLSTRGWRYEGVAWNVEK